MSEADAAPPILIRGASAVLVPSGPRFDQDITIEGGRITAIGVDLPSPAGALVLSGRDRLVAPGLVNAHWHSPMQASVGTADRLDHQSFMWLNQGDTAHRTADEIRLTALLGCIQMIRSGTTSVIDHFPEQGFEIEDVAAVVEALLSSGMRAVVALRIFDGAYTDIMPTGGQATPALLAAIARANPLEPRPAGESLALVRAAIDRFDRRANRVRIFPAPSNPMRCSDSFIEACQALAVDRDTGIHTHLLETRAQVAIAQQRYGTGLVQHLARLGCFDARWSCAHCNWLSAAEIEIMAAAGATAVLNPESNLKIGSGVPPVPDFLAAGLRCALGTDGASTNDNLVLQDAMQLTAIMHRAHEPDRQRWPTVEQILAMATRGGAGAMLEPELGLLALGQKADLVLYDLMSPVWIPLNDPVQQLVFGERGGSVHSVIIDGRLVMADGVIAGLDEATILREAGRVLAATRARNGPIRAIADAFAAPD